MKNKAKKAGKWIDTLFSAGVMFAIGICTVLSGVFTAFCGGALIQIEKDNDKKEQKVVCEQPAETSSDKEE